VSEGTDLPWSKLSTDVPLYTRSLSYRPIPSLRMKITFLLNTHTLSFSLSSICLSLSLFVLFLSLQIMSS